MRETLPKDTGPIVRLVLCRTWSLAGTGELPAMVLIKTIKNRDS